MSIQLEVLVKVIPYLLAGGSLCASSRKGRRCREINCEKNLRKGTSVCILIRMPKTME